ncbi:MAG: glycosyltransferase family 9 protein [Tepidisphaeraceae bacterium]
MAYTHRIDSLGGFDRHAVERYLDIAEALGCGRGPVEFPFHVTDADRSAVDAMRGDTGPYAVILPGTNWPTKKWPATYFGDVVPKLQSLGLDVVLAGAKDVVGLASAMPPGVIDLAAKTSLPQLVELLRRAKLVIANDSGPMHIASAVGTPMVTVFGPTNPVRTGPYGRDDTVLRLNLPCAPCYSRKCCHRICLDWLTPDDVMRAARVQLAR